jgi:hypothetical protein
VGDDQVAAKGRTAAIVAQPFVFQHSTRGTSAVIRTMPISTGIICKPLVCNGIKKRQFSINSYYQVQRSSPCALHHKHQTNKDVLEKISLPRVEHIIQAFSSVG